MDEFELGDDVIVAHWYEPAADDLCRLCDTERDNPWHLKDDEGNDGI
jgi:hypothetical protein